MRVRRPKIRKPLRKGSLVYHGTSSEEDFDELQGPAWVSDAESVAHEFMSWAGGRGTPRILTFRVTVAPSLAIIETDGEMRDLVQWLEDRTGLDLSYGTHDLAEAVCEIGDLDGWHIPNNYPSGSDTLLCEPDGFLEWVETTEVEP